MPLDDSEGVEGDEGFSTLSNPSLFLLPALPDVYVLGVEKQRRQPGGWELEMDFHSTLTFRAFPFQWVEGRLMSIIKWNRALLSPVGCCCSTYPVGCQGEVIDLLLGLVLVALLLRQEVRLQGLQRLRVTAAHGQPLLLQLGNTAELLLLQALLCVSARQPQGHTHKEKKHIHNKLTQNEWTLKQTWYRCQWQTKMKHTCSWPKQVQTRFNVKNKIKINP